MEDTLGRLHRFLAATDAGQISGDLIARYIGSRQQKGAAPATINRELGALIRAVRLAQSASKAGFRPEISVLPENNRHEDFFEADEYQALLDNLPEYLRPVIQTAYITGWRINSEILTLQKRQVDFDSAIRDLSSAGQAVRKVKPFR